MSRSICVCVCVCVMVTLMIPAADAFSIMTPSSIRALISSTSTSSKSPSRTSSLFSPRSSKHFVTSDASTGVNGDTATATTSTSTTSSTSYNSDEKFENKGLFSWMQTYLDIFGFVEGKTTFYGPGVDVDESQFPSKEEQTKLKNEAMTNMMNINTDERNRRGYASNIAYKIVFGYALFSSIFLDDGSFSGHLARFAIALVSTYM